MKPVKISYSFIIIILSSSFLILYFMLYAYQSGEPIKVQASNGTLYGKAQLQSYPENKSLPVMTQNNKSSTIIFSNPFYLSNATLMLAKIPIEKSSTINREVQFYVERGVINTTLITYNVGYYVEESNIDGSKSDSKPLSIDIKTKSGPNYTEGSGIFLTENGGIIGWDAFDQIINKSNDKIQYAGMIFFSPAGADKNNELSFLKNRVGIYEFLIGTDEVTKTPSASHYSHPPFSSSTTAPTAPTAPTVPTTHRTIWLWPHTH